MKDNFNMSDNDLDRELSSPGQELVREVVQALPEEPLSLAWRSDLNTRLHAVAARKKKLDLFGWIWNPAAGVALAGALAVAFVFRMPDVDHGVVATNKDVEKALVNTYVDSTASWEVAGDGIT